MHNCHHTVQHEAINRQRCQLQQAHGDLFRADLHEAFEDAVRRAKAWATTPLICPNTEGRCRNDVGRDAC